MWDRYMLQSYEKAEAQFKDLTQEPINPFFPTGPQINYFN